MADKDTDHRIKDGVDITDSSDVERAFNRAVRSAPPDKPLMIITGATGLIGQGLLSEIEKSSQGWEVWPLGGPSYKATLDAIVDDPGWGEAYGL